MFIEQALKTYLLAQTGLTALVGQHIYYPGEVPQNVVAPYIVMFNVSIAPVHSHGGSSHLSTDRFQLSVFSSTYHIAKQIVEQLKLALDGKTGNIGTAPGVRVEGILYDGGPGDLYEDDTKLHHIPIDFEVPHED